MSRFHGEFSGGCVPGGGECGGWGYQLGGPKDTAPSSPRSVGVPFPFDDRSSLRSPSEADSVCAPSPQSSTGGRTPQAAATPIPCWRVPEFSLITGFESPPSSPEWGPFGPAVGHHTPPPAPAAANTPSTWPWKESIGPCGDYREEPMIG